VNLGASPSGRIADPRATPPVWWLVNFVLAVIVAGLTVMVFSTSVSAGTHVVDARFDYDVLAVNATHAWTSSAGPDSLAASTPRSAEGDAAHPCPDLELSAPRTAPTSNAYSVAFETQLDDAVLGSSRSVHFNRANGALDDALQADPSFASAFDDWIPGASSAVSRAGGRTTLSGYTCHHAPSSAVDGRVGVMQLVPTTQHAPGSIWQRLLHPDGAGGYAEWAIPRGAPGN
jgi:hypothetical protein